MCGKADGDLSRLVYSTLDTFGFQRESVSFRSKVYDNISSIMTQKGISTSGKEIPISIVYVGSTGEGVALTDSDTDVMKIFSDTISVDKASAQSQFNILEVDYTTSSPGYAKLVAVYLDKSNYSHLLFESSYMYSTQRGYPYISSAAFRDYTHQLQLKNCFDRLREISEIVNFSNNGPATTYETNLFLGDHDIVYSMYYFGSEHLSKWKDRTRFNAWPSKHLVEEISQMEGYIVPAGDKLTESQFLEWRICYTTAEKKLISTLNDVQIKLYVLLKLIGKKLLKPVCKEITSYIIKNVVFWVIETEPVNSFSPELLLKLVQKSLLFLKHCLENNHFPNYMIPDRNLLGLVFGHYKIRTQRFLSECLKDEGAIFLRIPKLRELMYSSYTPLERAVYSEWRNEVEKLFFARLLLLTEPALKFSSLHEIKRESLKDKRFFEMSLKLSSMLVPEGFHLLLEGRTLEEVEELYLLRCKAIWPL